MVVDDVLPGVEWLIIFGAGFAAGVVNVVVGSGTLLSFPLLVLLGYPPLVANISSTIGLIPGSASGVVAYRRELLNRKALVRVLLPASTAGGLLGALLLLLLPAEVFSAIVPWLIGIGIGLVLLGPILKRGDKERTSVSGGSVSQQPSLSGASAGRRTMSVLPVSSPTLFPSTTMTMVAVLGTLLLGIYGGYFGAAQGILLMGLLGVALSLGMQELNAIKNLSVLAVNAIAAAVFIIVSPGTINWVLVWLIAAGSACGGFVGGNVAKRLSPRFLRASIVVVGVIAIVSLAAR